MTDPAIDLNFLANQQVRILEEIAGVRAEQASARADMGVLTAIALRQDTTLAHVLAELRAIHAMHANFDRRLRKLEEAS
jgi:hypothetical protein